MRHPVLSLVVLVAAASLLMLPLSAHHEITAKFDPAKTTTLARHRDPRRLGESACAHFHERRYRQQHGQLGRRTRKRRRPAAGRVTDATQLSRATRSLLREFLPETAASRSGEIQSRLPGTSVFSMCRDDAPSRAAAAPTPRWPDGKPRLGPTPGTTGYWAKPSMTILAETGTNIRANKNGLLANIADVDKVAPFQPWARDLFELRQRNRLADDPQYLYCLPPGGPRQYQEAYGVQFVEDKEHQRIFVFVGSVDHNWRLIYLDGRQQVGQVRGDADNPLYYGRAVGKWEGDSLVVDVKGFNEKFWLSNGGLPHTEKLHLSEKFTRTDANTLKYEVTIDDPGAYTRTWSSGWNLQWMPNEELPVFFCQDNRP